MSGGSGWPPGFAAGLHATLRRRLPPRLDGPELEQLTCDLVAALEQGALTVPLTPGRLHLATASGWLDGPAAPLLLQGDQIGWRRWLQAMNQMVEALLLRAEAVSPAPNSTSSPDPSPDLNPEQIAAVLALDRCPVVLISGGPGTGKTSTVVALLQRAEARNPGLRIGLAAPTGKAARRLGDAVLSRRSPLPCGTLHRWLEAGSRGFRRHRLRPLELDLLVIDEMSMLDLALMQALLDALPQSCRLVLVGDPAQLPPVGSGAVWHRLQQRDVRERFGPGAVHLVRTYRNRGVLAQLAECLRQEDPARFLQFLRAMPESSNVRHHQVSIRRLPSWLREHWRRRLEDLASAAFGLESCSEAELLARASPLLDALERELVLCPRRRGPWGLEDVHKSLLGEAAVADPRRWPAGLPVICGGNQADLGLANGDLGVVIGSGAGMRLLFRVMESDGEVRLRLLQPARLRRLEPAMALTIHRAQGSEVDRVTVLWPEVLDQKSLSETPPVSESIPALGSSEDRCLENCPMDDHQRRLLYTAITRARVSVDLVSVV